MANKINDSLVEIFRSFKDSFFFAYLPLKTNYKAMMDGYSSSFLERIKIMKTKHLMLRLRHPLKNIENNKKKNIFHSGKN